ncbi:MerR family transcriptional regulator [Planotetraspora thailandica]|uniref:MerR family transcriptional regulator n=1 Tax=Planotetraspora thailandica TaxID=487172 RepID=A0A8J3V2G4_9ACTN|nr:helix-turn-helix domain-containing protein [Planotetraspora thailandica]GII56233.1 MerR family transcriptional regulator [Planotetraspora thailandica]
MNLVPIGEFARLSRLSPKALRLYAALGLLVPASVDPDSGYRRYAVAQLEQARLVASLRRIGVPLARIRVIVDLDAETASRHVAAFWAEIEAEHAARRELAGHLVDLLKGKVPAVHEVSLRDIPARRILSLIRHVHNDGLLGVAREFTGRFRGGSLPLLPGVAGAPFVVHHGEVSQDSDGPIEWCWPVPEEQAATLAARFPDLTLRTENAHQEAYIAQGTATQPMIALDTLTAWAAEHGHRPAAGVRQIYLHSPAGSSCEFAVPLR